MPLKAIIIDDEKDAVFALRKMLEQFCTGVVVAGEASNALSGLKLIQQVQPDVVFLDVEMPGGTGFEMLETFEGSPFSVVFTTAYQQYAISAIRAGAADYLLKPIDVEELRNAIARVEARLAEQRTSRPSYEEYKVKIVQQNGTFFLPCQDILCIEGDGRYSTIFGTDGKTHLVSRNLKEFEEELAPYRFFRVHKSFLVNCRHVVRISHSDGGFAVMSDGRQIEISRRKKVEFQEFMKR